MKKNTIYLLIMIFTLPAMAQFVEEIGTLESIYEGRARAVLNSFLRPTEYTVVISAEIDHDAKKLQDYQEKMEMQFVPGLPIPADPNSMPATNDLHGMKSKITVNLILNSDVPPEKENLLKSVLTSKLHLDEATGDAVVVSRAKLPDMQPPSSAPHLLPEFSWKTWALIFILALLAFAALIFWLYARRTDDESVTKSGDEDLARGIAGSEGTAAPAMDEAEKKIPADLDLSGALAEAKDQLLFFASQYPTISSKGVVEMMDRQLDDVVRTFEFISWDLSRRMFPGLSPSAWGRLGATVKQAESKATPAQYLESLKLVYRHLLARFLESGAQKDDSNPFSFIFRLSQNERRQLMQVEPVTNYAVISLFCQPDELKLLTEGARSEILDGLPQEMSKLESLPEARLNALAMRLKESLRQIKEAPSVYADGAGLAAKVLRSYSPEREASVFARMKAENPASADKIRRLIVQFDDLEIYPAEIVSTALSLMDVDQLVRALFNSNGSLRQHLISVMPPKRAKMVERDLERTGFMPAESEVYASRRLLCLKVEEILASRGQVLPTLWDQIQVNEANGSVRMAG